MRYGALNPLPDGVQLAVADEEKILLRAFAPMRAREASGLPRFVERELDSIGLAIGDISFWSTGSGPGGFTALRMTAALVAAWALGREEIKFRCVPSAIALAGNLPGSDGEELDCLFDGRNNEILLYGLVFRQGEWRPRNYTSVMNGASWARYAAAPRRCAVSESEAEAVKRITGETPLEKCSPDCVNLIRTTVFPYDTKADDLVYIREAVELKA
ncbi:MAG: hypothetical protein IJT50_06535 [Lentisphaeria bacterium]|nr:hypothetical protein [Lentisphaeria bacterium]